MKGVNYTASKPGLSNFNNKAEATMMAFNNSVAKKLPSKRNRVSIMKTDMLDETNELER